jgi:PEP-CTERM motif
MTPPSPRPMATRPGWIFALAVLPVLLGSPAAAESIFDDFNDGNDVGWTRIEPLAPFGAPGTFSFPNGGYRLQAAASPNPAALGRARVYSLRLDLNLTNFQISADVVNWNNNLNQSFGVIARFREPGLATSDGYLFDYNPNENGPGMGELLIARADNEATRRLTMMALTLDPAQDYRLVFTGVGATLTGQVFNVNNLALPLATITANDDTYTSGSSGVLVGASQNAPTSAADATFDNFQAVTVPEPASWALLAVGLVGLGLLALRRP